MSMQIWNPITKQWFEQNLITALEDKRAGMFYSYIPPPSEVTLKTKFPFQMYYFLPVDTQPIIHLYSQYSRSRPPQIPESKWGHLLPQWKFYDHDKEFTLELKPDYTRISNGTEIVGVTGIAEFYYTDDMPTLEDCPLHIWTTLDTSEIPVTYDQEKVHLPGHSNSSVTISLAYHINGQNPGILKYTRNGIDPIGNEYSKWQNVQFPYFLTVHGDFASGVCSAMGNPILFDYPQESLNVSIEEFYINRTMVHSPSTEFLSGDQIWDPDTQHFQRYDENNFHTGGFVRGSVTSLISAEQAALSANIKMQYYETFRDYPYVWVSNPENNTVNILQFFQQRSEDCPTSEDTGFKVNGPNGQIEITPLTGHFTSFDVPYVTNKPDPMALTGFGGIFGIAADPCYDAWFADAELDALFKYDSKGNQLSALYLKEISAVTALNPTISADSGLTPAGIALDEHLNLWVTLFDFVSTLKFDPNGELLFVTQPLDAQPPRWLEDAEYKGPMVDTDTENNAWVTYSNYPYSKLVKYSGIDGSILVETSTEQLSSTPIDILVNGADNSVWTTNAFSHHLSGSVTHYSSAGDLLNTWEVPYWPSYLTIDRGKNIWFTYGHNLVGKIDPNSSTIDSFVVSANMFTQQTGIYDVPDWYDMDERLDTTALQGIACDTRNRIWIINSQENRVYVVDAETTDFSSDPRYASFYIIPNANISWNNDTDYANPQQYEVYDWWYQSAQAFGDWTGYRWYQKYYPHPSEELQTITLTAVSNDFEILPYANPYCIRRFNESWDAAEATHNLVLSEHQYENFNAWMNYIGTMIGGMECDEQSLGRQSYEKIANFTKDHADIDAAGIDQLYSIANQMDVPIDDYQFEMPTNLRRLMDIYSVPHHKLWGARCKCNRNFTTSNFCGKCGHVHKTNVGSIFDPLTYMVSAGEPFLVRYIHANEYKIVNPAESYPLSATSYVGWLQSSEYENYYFYEWNQTYCDYQSEGIINWDDHYTTLSESSSSIEEWYKDNGLIEKMIAFELYKGLGI